MPIPDSMRLALLLFLVSLTGCAATVAVPPSAYADTAARLDGRRVAVVLADGTVWDATALRLGPDSTSWFDAADGKMRVVPTASVAEIEHRDLRRQAQRGAVRGIVGASLYVLAIQGLVGTNGFFGNPASYEDGGILVVAPTGAAVGALGAMFLGASDRYVMAPPDTLRDRGSAR